MAKMGRPAVEEPKDKRVSMRVTEKTTNALSHMLRNKK